MRKYELRDERNRVADRNLTLLEVINLSDFSDKEVDDIASMSAGQQMRFDDGNIVLIREN